MNQSPALDQEIELEDADLARCVGGLRRIRIKRGAQSLQKQQQTWTPRGAGPSHQARQPAWFTLGDLPCENITVMDNDMETLRVFSAIEITGY